jgi:hypothetical protein
MVKAVVSNHAFGSPVTVIAPVRSGRRVLAVPVKAPEAMTGVTGFPLWNWPTVDTCQPSTKALPLKGSSYNTVATNRCRAS